MKMFKGHQRIKPKGSVKKNMGKIFIKYLSKKIIFKKNTKSTPSNDTHLPYYILMMTRVLNNYSFFLFNSYHK